MVGARADSRTPAPDARDRDVVGIARSRRGRSHDGTRVSAHDGSGITCRVADADVVADDHAGHERESDTRHQRRPTPCQPERTPHDRRARSGKSPRDFRSEAGLHTASRLPRDRPGGIRGLLVATRLRPRRRRHHRGVGQRPARRTRRRCPDATRDPRLNRRARERLRRGRRRTVDRGSLSRLGGTGENHRQPYPVGPS